MAAKAGAEAQNIMLTGVGETSEKEMLLLRYGLLMISIKLGIFCGDFEGIRARLFPSQEQGKLSEHQFRVSGVLWIDSALAVFRKDDPKRAHLLVKCRGEMERAFADLGPGVEDEVLRTGLEDLDLLLTFAKSSSLADMSTLDWAAELGPQHADLLVLANGGDAAAMSDIGAKFGAGDGVKRNALYASYWYERASNGGNAVAALNLAQMYRHGEGVQMDLERGVALTRLAAERGLTMAKCNLGVMLMLGQGCTGQSARGARVASAGGRGGGPDGSDIARHTVCDRARRDVRSSQGTGISCSSDRTRKHPGHTGAGEHRPERPIVRRRCVFRLKKRDGTSTAPLAYSAHR